MIPAIITYQLDATQQLITARNAVLEARRLLSQAPLLTARLTPLQYAQLEHMVEQLDACVLSVMVMKRGGRHAST